MLRFTIVLGALVACTIAADAAAAAAAATTTTTKRPVTTTTAKKPITTTTNKKPITTTTNKKPITTTTNKKPITTTTTKKPTTQTCTNVMAKTEIASILQLHNNLRSQISEGKFVAKGTKMPAALKPIAKLSWDCKLEKAAAKVAAGCKLVPNKSPFGQNTYFYNGTAVLSSTSGQIASAAGIWAGEFTKFGWPTVNYTAAVAKLGVSDATQMAWAKTRKVGCGVALCNAKKSALVVCKYKVAGNKLNMNVYAPKPTSG